MTFTRSDCNHEGIGKPGCLICDVRPCAECGIRGMHERTCSRGPTIKNVEVIPLPTQADMDRLRGFNPAEPYDFDPDPEAGRG